MQSSISMEFSRKLPLLPVDCPFGPDNQRNISSFKHREDLQGVLGTLNGRGVATHDRKSKNLNILRLNSVYDGESIVAAWVAVEPDLGGCGIHNA